MTCYSLNKSNVRVGTCEPMESYFDSPSGKGWVKKNPVWKGVHVCPVTDPGFLERGF